VLPVKSEVAFPSRFYCKRGVSKTCVHALMRYTDGPDLISAVLTVTEEQAAFDVARLLNLSVRELLAQGLAAEVERVAAGLPAAPRASFREALERLRVGTWPVEQIAEGERFEARSSSKRVNFKSLFPLPDCDHSESEEDDEGWCEKCEECDFTPRSAVVLAEAFWQLSEEAADDVRVHGSDRVERGASWAVFDELPAVTWRLPVRLIQPPERSGLRRFGLGQAPIQIREQKRVGYCLVGHLASLEKVVAECVSAAPIGSCRRGGFTLRRVRLGRWRSR
jgi:hypothetical protein